MKGVRGAEKSPGEIRRIQNRIGGTRPGNAAYVPPPPHTVGELLGELERFLHQESDLPALVRAGLVHAQFETIRPYLDGNGRIGRLLIALLLEQWKLLEQPLLYLSLFFKQHRTEYYRRLDAVRTQGDFEGWMAFFLEGTAVVAEEAIRTIQDLFTVVTAGQEVREQLRRPLSQRDQEGDPSQSSAYCCEFWQILVILPCRLEAPSWARPRS